MSKSKNPTAQYIYRALSDPHCPSLQSSIVSDTGHQDSASRKLGARGHVPRVSDLEPGGRIWEMAAAQVAKKLKDKRQQRTIEGIFKKVSIVELSIVYLVSSI